MPIPPDRVFEISEITDWIKSSLERDFPDITVEGEISNFRPASSGHCYFSLKDESALLSAVLFRSSLQNLTFLPKDGMKVRARGRISVYPQRGTYQLICQRMEKQGQGDLLQLIEETKRRLSAEGLFDEDRKRDIPSFPSRIAVVTSPTGAAVRDILQILKRRNSCVSVVILPAAVQGGEAPAQLVRQIRRANRFRLGDTLIIGRGGGSLEDLMAFNSEEVVRAVAASEIPVISAVGHEIDISLSDFAADLRAPTPSAAAELAVPDLSDLQRQIGDISMQLNREMGSRLDLWRERLSQVDADHMRLLLRQKLEPGYQRLDDLKSQIQQSLLFLFQQKKQNLIHLPILFLPGSATGLC